MPSTATAQRHSAGSARRLATLVAQVKRYVGPQMRSRVAREEIGLGDDGFDSEAAFQIASIHEESIMVPMRDGVRLSVHLYTPPGDGPWPGLLQQIYGDPVGAAQAMRRLASHGYVVALQNFRGCQKSEGRYQGYRALGFGELKDGFDTVEWLASIPQCNGKVGTMGGSQAGFAQNFTAVAAPPSLVCQYMSNTGLSLFEEGYRLGGLTRYERFRTAMTSACREPADNFRLIKEWSEHPDKDAYWMQEDCTPHFGRMNVPCFTQGSWYDYMNRGSVASFAGRQHNGGPESRGQQKLLIGPWQHGPQQSRVGDLTYPDSCNWNITASMLSWFNHHLKGIPGPETPTVQYFNMGACEDGAPGNTWRVADDFPLSHAVQTEYTFRAGGTVHTGIPQRNSFALGNGELGWSGGQAVRSKGVLTTVGESRPGTKPKAQDLVHATTWRSDPNQPASLGQTVGFAPGATDQRLFESHGEDVAIFTTAALAEPVEWTGMVRAELVIASTGRDTDIIVRITDVYPDGRSILVLEYAQRARYRNGFDRQQLLTPGEPAEIKFDVGWTSMTFNKGHRIRASISSSGYPLYEPNHHQDGSEQTLQPPPGGGMAVINTILHGGPFKSRIIAPVVPTCIE